MIRALAALLAAAVAGLAAIAPARAELTADEQAQVARATAYLNGIENIAGRFVQIDPDGVTASGSFHIARPGRARFDYDDQELVVVARGQRLLIREGAFVTNELPLTGTPLKVLLSREVDLARDAEILAVDSRAGTLALTLRDPDAPDLGQATLIFAGAGPQLDRWIVIDAQGLMTTVSLSDITYPARIDPDLFQLRSGSLPRDRLRD